MMAGFEARFIICLLWLCISISAQAQISIKDDAGHTLTLQQPASRIISLAPFLTEMMYELDALDKLIAIDNYSDYPVQVKQKDKVGSIHGLDYEKIIQLKPDVILLWHSGYRATLRKQLQALNIPIYHSEPTRLQDIPATLQRLGKLIGHQQQAHKAVAAFRGRLRSLTRTQQGKSSISVFYEIWQQPLLTINSQHLINDVLRLCGARNIFADVPVLTPNVTVEAVLQRDPQVIIASISESDDQHWRQFWLKWRQLAAVRNQALYFVNPDYMARHASRILLGAEQVCGYLNEVRERLEKD